MNKTSAYIFDLAIIGGGIGGIGVAIAAAKSGLSVVLLEKDTLGVNTSSASLRIMHGGFRYLQQLNISRTLRSCRAQAELVRSYPELIKWFPCIMPLSGKGLQKAPLVRLALLLFSVLSRLVGSSVPSGAVLSSTKAVAQAPILKGKVANGALLWWDALLLSHQGLINKLKTELSNLGVQLRENFEASFEIAEGEGFKVVGPGHEDFVAKNVCNCSGAWLQSTRKADDKSHKLCKAKVCKAFNIITTRKITEEAGIALPAPSGRMFFATPRGSNVAIGTQYLNYSGDPQAAHVSEEELQTFINEINLALPEAPLSRDEIVDVELGLLPVSRDTDLMSSTKLYQTGKYYELMTTKYTTFLVDGRMAVRKICAV